MALYPLGYKTGREKTCFIPHLDERKRGGGIEGMPVMETS